MIQAFLNWLKNLFSPKVSPVELPKKVAKDLIRPIQEQLAGDSTEPKWLRVARGEIGVKEAIGNQDNPRVVGYHLSTTLDKSDASEDETPWCSSFVNWCMEKAGEDGTNSAWARSWLKWGYPMDVPNRGCVVVFSRGNSSGHVAFFL